MVRGQVPAYISMHDDVDDMDAFRTVLCGKALDHHIKQSHIDVSAYNFITEVKIKVDNQIMELQHHPVQTLKS